MLCLVHGENPVGIRNTILKTANDLKKPAIKELELTSSTDFSIVEAQLQPDLFSEKALLCLEVNKINKEQVEKIINLLKEYPENDVLLFSYKTLTANSILLKELIKLKTKIITIPAIKRNQIFDFTRKVFELKRAEAYTALQKLLEIDNDPNFILAMLQYQLRNVTLVKFDAAQNVSPFQIAQAKTQASNFSPASIVELYETFYNLERNFKSGKLNPQAVCVLAVERVFALGKK